MKTYKKLIANPLGLALVVIHADTFTDEKLSEKDMVKIKLALKADMIVEVDTAVEAKDTAVKADDEVTKLTAALEAVTKQRDDAVAFTLELKKDLVAGWEEMDAETLAKEFTVPELKYIADMFEDMKYNANIKEAALATKIVEAREAQNVEE